MLPIKGKRLKFVVVVYIFVMFIDSTISCPTHGIALIKLVITVAKS